MVIRDVIFGLKQFRVILIIVFLSFGALYVNAGFSSERTFILHPGQYPVGLKKYGAAEIYILYAGPQFPKVLDKDIFHEDTIINYRIFTDRNQGSVGYRLIYKTGDKIDSVSQLDSKFRVTSKATILSNGRMHILVYDSTLKKTDEFVFDYAAKFRSKTIRSYNGLSWLLRQYTLYDSYDRSNFTSGAVWILSIGIDDYGATKYRTCKTDAQSYNEFFKQQFTGSRSNSDMSSLFHEYLLVDKDATREAILAALKDIAGKAAFNDYFIFNFSGCSNVIKDVENAGTIFFPYDVVVDAGSNNDGIRNREVTDASSPLAKCISLKLLQEYFQSIAAVNQLFISEAGPSEKFKTEFIKTLMQNSPEVASILNKNRVIIVPNGIGYDNVKCNGKLIEKGPINYYITSSRSDDFKNPVNIFDLFNQNKANEIAFKIKNKAYDCQSFSFDYFDIFFERKFLKEYKEIFGDAAGQTRGLGLKAKELRSAANFSGKQYALVVGTDNYKGAGWKKLPNAINDARAVSDMLGQGYGFEVQLLEDKPMDTIYKAIAAYYRNLQPNDQLVIYFAGHGDMEDEFMDDGFIVCSDSRSRMDDPARNTYIQYVKLQKMINRIPARQILVMLDVCHGGSFNQKRSDPAKTITNTDVTL